MRSIFLGPDDRLRLIWPVGASKMIISVPEQLKTDGLSPKQLSTAMPSTAEAQGRLALTPNVYNQLPIRMNGAQ
jgi:hypothetical protein